MKEWNRFGYLLIIILIKGAKAPGTFSIVLSDPTINTATGIESYVYPSSNTANLESKVICEFDFVSKLYSVIPSPSRNHVFKHHT
jgi:hypothetical protein